METNVLPMGVEILDVISFIQQCHPSYYSTTPTM